MFTIEDIRKEYERLDNETGNNIAKISLEISNRCKTTRGKYCFFQNPIEDEPFKERIVISAFVLKESECDFLDTIRHEYAHAMSVRKYGVNAGNGHGYYWKKCCCIIGCKDETTREATEAQKAALQNRKQYVIYCSCGRKFIYYRKSKIVSMIEKGNCATLKCPVCGGHDFKLEK